MNLFLKSFVFLLMTLLFACGVAKQPIVKQSIIGSWEGCDGRVVTYANENDTIKGRFTKLGALETYGFKINEVGFILENKANGVYEGKVKWRYKDDDKEYWRNVSIKVAGENYEDKGSDACSKKMKRIPNN